MFAPIYTRNYSYKDYAGSSDRTTNLLDSYIYRKPSDGSIISGNAYDYDANGNITKVYEVYGADLKRLVAEYTYDDLNQLQSETRLIYAGVSAVPTDTVFVEYTIDTAGNISEVETSLDGIVTDTVSYTYGDSFWSDRLSAITVNGVTKNISYSYYGGGNCNPENWYNGTEFTDLTWTQGRRLSSITEGSQTYSYEYDMSGIRSVKIADGLKHEYVTQSGRVVREKVTNANTGAFQYILDFTYDESGHPLTMRRYYNEAESWYNTYRFICNAQGDVVKLLHGTSAIVAEYSYDAWGKLLTATGSLADVNPLRYRGYYFDTETGFYYLQSRYYDPALGRFLNADGLVSTGQGFLGYNMFAYCNCDPVITKDSEGSRCVDVELEGGTRKREKSEYIPGTVNKSLMEAESIEEARRHSIDDGFYNCYGFAIGKAIFQNPTNWNDGDSVREVFRAVQADLGGSENCRELSSIDVPCNPGWYKVALRCTEDNDEYHFIRQIGGTWYSKSGDCPDKPIMVTSSYILGDMWGILQYSSPLDVNVPYTGEIIFFEIREGWDHS